MKSRALKIVGFFLIVLLSLLVYAAWRGGQMRKRQATIMVNKLVIDSIWLERQSLISDLPPLERAGAERSLKSLEDKYVFVSRDDCDRLQSARAWFLRTRITTDDEIRIKNARWYLELCKEISLKY